MGFTLAYPNLFGTKGFVVVVELKTNQVFRDKNEVFSEWTINIASANVETWKIEKELHECHEKL